MAARSVEQMDASLNGAVIGAPPSANGFGSVSLGSSDRGLVGLGGLVAAIWLQRRMAVSDTGSVIVGAPWARMV